MKFYLQLQKHYSKWLTRNEKRDILSARKESIMEIIVENNVANVIIMGCGVGRFSSQRETISTDSAEVTELCKAS